MIENKMFYHCRHTPNEQKTFEFFEAFEAEKEKGGATGRRSCHK